MEITKAISKWGNSAGVILPKDWIGKQARIILIDRTKEIQKEIFSILQSHLEDIIGIYLTGSYSRGEQNEESDIDIIAISYKIKKEISSGRYNISIYPLKNIKKTLERNPIQLLPRLIEAKTIINNNLLEELKKYPLKNKIKEYLKETKRIIKINKEIIELDKIDGENLKSKDIIYSLILRLRGIYLIDIVLTKKIYSRKKFEEFLLSATPEAKNAIEIYNKIKSNKKNLAEIKIKTAEELIYLLEKEVKKYE